MDHRTIYPLEEPNILILGIGVSPYKTDGVLRFEHFCNVFGLEYKIVGDGKIWRGGDMEAGPGGGQKINEILETIKDMDNKLLVICDTFDLFPLAGQKEILEKFNFIRQEKENYVIFSSEVYCWPDRGLESTYPPSENKYRFLNSGSVIGYRDDIYNLIKEGTANNEDDQRFFTKKYLSGQKIILDHKCELFQTLNGSKEDIILHKNRLYNQYTNSYPIFVHGNGPSKLFLNYIENYIEPEPFVNYSYTLCPSLTILENSPKIFCALYIDSTKWNETNIFIKSVVDINYPNKEIHIYDSNHNRKTEVTMNMFGFVYHNNTSGYDYDDFKNSDCQYYFLLEQRCVITEPNILCELVPLCNGYHRIIAPLLASKNNKYFTNFWGDIDKKGYYLRSEDYLQLVDLKKRGLWNSPYVSGAILINRNIIMNWDLQKENNFTNDIDMHLCCNLRKETLFMYMANFKTYGYLNQ